MFRLVSWLKIALKPRFVLYNIVIFLILAFTALLSLSFWTLLDICFCFLFESSSHLEGVILDGVDFYYVIEHLFAFLDELFVEVSLLASWFRTGTFIICLFGREFLFVVWHYYFYTIKIVGFSNQNLYIAMQTKKQQ